MPISWLLAGMLGMKLPLTLDLDWLSVLSLMVLGVLLAADARLPPVAVASIGVIYGAIHGLLNGSALAVMGAGPSSLFGIVLAVVLLALLTAAGVIPLRALWARVAVRVVGSWLAAVGLLMLGWLAQGVA